MITNDGFLYKTNLLNNIHEKYVGRKENESKKTNKHMTE
jgi:hypothetical protein